MADRYWVGGSAAWSSTANWSLTSGGAGGQAKPTGSDDVYFDANSGSATVTNNTSEPVKSLNCTGFTGTFSGTGFLSFSSTGGNMTLSSGMTYGFTGANSFFGTTTITSNGTSIPSIQIYGAVTLGGALTITGATINTSGSLNLNGFPLSTNTFSSNGTSARSIAFGSQNIALTSTTTGATILFMSTATNFTWTGTGGFTRNQAATATVSFGSTAGGSASNAPNLTVNAGGSFLLTITSGAWFKNVDFTGSVCQVVSAGNGFSLVGNLTLASGGSYGSMLTTVVGSSTITSNGASFGNLVINGSGITATFADALTTTGGGALTMTAGTLKLKSGVTSTVGSLVTSGTTLKYLQSTTPGTQATLSDTSGTNTVTYLDIKDINATGGAVFDAIDASNLNSGNNTGWLFASAMFLMFF